MMYLDNIIIFSQDELQHLEHLEIVFSCLREAGLKMKCSKCDFLKSEIHYLGHLIYQKESARYPINWTV